MFYFPYIAGIPAEVVFPAGIFVVTTVAITALAGCGALLALIVRDRCSLMLNASPAHFPVLEETTLRRAA